MNELRKKLTETIQLKGRFADEEVIRAANNLIHTIVEMQSRQIKL
ncbi:aspartyl-phosphate phosphatase Spo0E family protein [Paenibacillus sp. MER 180]|nr:aspartyl-phosphate phosphatase Spo0E family protein [Paenibacillus sp. MER 180]